MSFLAGRLASTEGAYFLQESKQAVTRILQNQKNTANVVIKPIAENNEISSADVLPEVLRHSLPPKIFSSPPENPSSSFTKSSKWVFKREPGSRVSADALNPLRAYVSLPQVTFGPKRSLLLFSILFNSLAFPLFFAILWLLLSNKMFHGGKRWDSRFFLHQVRSLLLIMCCSVLDVRET